LTFSERDGTSVPTAATRRRAVTTMKRAEPIVAHRYRLVEQLGRGGMGVVWRARDERLGRDVAIKVLHSWVAEDPELRERFDREASALARLEHPNVVRLYDVLEDGGQTVLVLELVDGDGLHVLVAGRALDWAAARRFCAPVAAGLAHAHARGVVHRDLTPSNVLVERGTGRVVVTDFGLARLVRSSTSAPVSGILAGTPEYWAPEQATGEATGPATDLYALGCILFQLLAGRLPFEGEDRLATGLRRAHEPAPSLAAARPGVPAEATALVDRLLARSPDARGSAAEAAVALGAEPAEAATGRQSEASALLRPRGDAPRSAPPTLVTRILREPATIVHRARSVRTLRRGRAAAAAVAVAAVAGLAGGAVFAIAGGDPPGVHAPDVVGASVARARAEVVRRAHDADAPVPKVKVVKRAYSESAPNGVIVAQDPPDGERIPERGALLVSVSRGSAFRKVPSVSGLESGEARALLDRIGFVATKRYAPSSEIAAWHAMETSPAAGTRVKRPAHVQVTISTGPPRRPIPTVDGLSGADARKTIGDAGFSATVVKQMDKNADPGTVLAVTPEPGSRAQLGSSVTITVARAPRWTPVDRVEGTEDARTEPLTVPAGDRLVLTTVDTSPLGLFGGAVDVGLSGDVGDVSRVGAGESVVLTGAADGPRTIQVALDVHGSVHWALAVEEPR
jgi:eukaryotic-like serine/threonine-protein kinase